MISTTIIIASFVVGALVGCIIGAALVTWIARKTGLAP